MVCVMTQSHSFHHQSGGADGATDPKGSLSDASIDPGEPISLSVISALLAPIDWPSETVAARTL